MPEMDGVEVLRQVKTDPELAHIPVLMLSALDELDAVVHCIGLGAEDYLPKPFPAAILQARIQACLANKRMSDQLGKYTGWLFGKTLFSQAVAAPGSLNLTRQERTILFADIRGFTHWSERHVPQEAVTMLNRAPGTLPLLDPLHADEHRRCLVCLDGVGQGLRRDKHLSRDDTP